MQNHGLGRLHLLVFTITVVNFLVGEKLGRRRTIWIAMVWIIVGTTLQTSALTIPHLVVGRIITGIGTGMESATVPTYVSLRYLEGPS